MKFFTEKSTGKIAASSTDHLMAATACFAIGEISRKSPLPLPSGSDPSLGTFN